MGLVIEVAIDVNKTASISETKHFLSEMAYNYNCIDEYYIYETEGYNSVIERNDCIHIVEFNIPLTQYEKTNISYYIEKLLQKKYIKLETIYKDDGKVEMIYNCIKCNYSNVNGKFKYVKNKPIMSIIREKIYSN